MAAIITSWNRAAERLFGYTAEEAVGQSIHLLIPEDRADEEFVIIGKVRAGQRVEHFETVRRRKDGGLIDISVTVSPIHDDRGEVIGASKIARDIGAIRNAERASAYLAAIVDSSDDAIVSKDLNGVITSWNKAAERIFGHTAAEAVGRHISLIIPPDRMDEELTIISKVKAGQRLDHFQTVRQRRDGTMVPLSITVSPILDKNSTIIGASKVARDISEQKNAEAALVELAQRKDEFLANISHELRTPMNAVIGLARILGASASLTAKERYYAETLMHSADSLMALINNLLDFSKLENGILELEQIPFSLAETAERTVSLLRVKAEEKGLVLGLTYLTPIHKQYTGDPLRIQQVLTNLIGNAIKFTGEGSVQVSIAARPHTEGKTMLTIAVADTGIGIPDDKLGMIFEKFVQADASTTRKYGGSGLGLSICRAVAERMGGAIGVESKPGIGTTFTAEFPVAGGAADAALETHEASVRARKNVLIVDDYEPNVVVASALLDQFGYTYDAARNGAEALRRVRQESYDVILMDVQMHDMDGFETTRCIRALEHEGDARRIPIIAMTAHVTENDKHKCFDAGMDDFVPKPFDPDRLKLLLAQHIGPSVA